MVFKKSIEKVSQQELPEAGGIKKVGRGRPKGMGLTLNGGNGQPGRKKVNKQIETYSVYIYRVLKQVHPETGISKRSMSIMNSLINDVFEKICSEASKLVNNNKKHTLSSLNMLCRLLNIVQDLEIFKNLKKI